MMVQPTASYRGRIRTFSLAPPNDLMYKLQRNLWKSFGNTTSFQPELMKCKKYIDNYVVQLRSSGGVVYRFLRQDGRLFRMALKPSNLSITKYCMNRLPSTDILSLCTDTKYHTDFKPFFLSRRAVGWFICVVVCCNIATHLAIVGHSKAGLVDSWEGKHFPVLSSFNQTKDLLRIFQMAAFLDQFMAVKPTRKALQNIKFSYGLEWVWPSIAIAIT